MNKSLSINIYQNNIDAVSFVIVVRNDLIGFKSTFLSIFSQFEQKDEILVVDGSDSCEVKEYLKLKLSYDDCRLKYFRDNKKGVFAAQNIGLKAATKYWICVINSADKLIDGGRSLISNKINCNYSLECHIFSQKAVNKDLTSNYIFTPNAVSLWPHQSVVIRKSIHELYGYYDEKLRYSAEQFFFATIRKKVAFETYPEVLTEYLLGGISDRVDIKHCKEQYKVRRTIGRGLVVSIFQAWISPYLRVLLRGLIGESSVNKIKKLVFFHYKSK